MSPTGIRTAAEALLCTALLLAGTAAQQGPWTKLQDLPFNVLGGSTCAVLNDNLVVVANNQSMSAVLQLNGVGLETEWTTVSLPFTPGLWPKSAVDGNVLRVVTYDAQDGLPKLLIFSPPNDWAVTDLHVLSENTGEEVEILLPGGFTGGSFVPLQSGSKSAFMYCGGADTIDEVLYNSCYVMEVEPDSLTINEQVGLELPYNNLQWSCHGGDGQQFFVIAGGNEWESFNGTTGILQKDVLLLNGINSTWETLTTAALPSPRDGQAGVFVNDTLICIGGLNELQRPVKSMDIVNITSQMVFEGPPLPVDGYDGCAVVHSGVVYWIRGSSKGPGAEEYLSTAEVYRAEVTALLS